MDMSNDLERVNQTTQELERGQWVEKITGSGHYEVCLLPDSCLQRTFTIQAQKDADGNVSGNWTLISRHSAGNTNENHYHGSVECFTIDGDMLVLELILIKVRMLEKVDLIFMMVGIQVLVTIH